MDVKVLLPILLRQHAEGQHMVVMTLPDDSTLDDLLKRMEEVYPGMVGKFFVNEGESHNRWINYYVNGEDSRFLSHGATTLTIGCEVSIVPAVAGG